MTMNKITKKIKNSNVVANYLFLISILIVGIILIVLTIKIYHKEKKIGENLGEVDVKEIGSSYTLVKTPNDYKIRIKEELLVSNLQDLKFVIKDEEGNVICTCYYQKKISSLVCDNCSVE